MALTIRHLRAPVAKHESQKVAYVETPKSRFISATTLAALQATIRLHPGVTPEAILSDCRSAPIVRARRTMALELHFVHGWSTCRIATALRRDRTSINHLVGLTKKSPYPYSWDGAEVELRRMSAA